MGETILLIDDDEFVVTIGEAMLNKLGYKALSAQSGEQALQLMEDQGEPADLVIMDMVMPGMDGEELFDRIHALRPSLPVILSSGYPQDEHIDQLINKGCRGFIKKPYRMSELAQQIEAAF